MTCAVTLTLNRLNCHEYKYEKSYQRLLYFLQAISAILLILKYQNAELILRQKGPKCDKLIDLLLILDCGTC